MIDLCKHGTLRRWCEGCRMQSSVETLAALLDEAVCALVDAGLDADGTMAKRARSAIEHARELINPKEDAR